MTTTTNGGSHSDIAHGASHPYSLLLPKLPKNEHDLANGVKALDLNTGESGPYPSTDYGDGDVLPIKPTGGVITMVESPPRQPFVQDLQPNLPPPLRSELPEQFYSPKAHQQQQNDDPVIYEQDFDPFVQSYQLGVVEPFPVDPQPQSQLGFNAFPTEVEEARQPQYPNRGFSEEPSITKDDSFTHDLALSNQPTFSVDTGVSGDSPNYPTDGHTEASSVPDLHSRKTRGKNTDHPYRLPPHLQYQQQPFNFKSQEMSPERLPMLSPTFGREMLGLPGTNSLLALSLVTNLNLNHPAAAAGYPPQIAPALSELYLRLETSLLVPGAAHRYGHLRLVSLLLSFYYDRSDAALIINSQDLIQQYLGNNSSNLVPRMKTIELYRMNAKKTNDPTVIFQFAQYMLQTALMLEVEDPKAGQPAPAAKTRVVSAAIKLSLPPRGKLPRKLKSQQNLKEAQVDERKLQRSLIKEAVHYLKKLSDKGYPEAQYLLADAYSLGALGKVDNRDAFVLFQQAAKHGHTELAYRTLICFEEGLGTGRDARKAVEYLKIAASKNHPAAMYKMGMYMFYGRMGVAHNTNNEKMGIKWLTRALNVANELTAAAPYELGKLYYHGYKDIVIADKKYALELYSQAAALGHVQLASILGKCYEVGEVVPQDGNLLIHYYTQAALGGDPEAMLAMCAWYLVGCEPHLPKDELEAFEWAKRAANCGSGKAQFAVANFYDKGIGCIKNVQDAQLWYQKAAQQGDEKALSRLLDKTVAAKVKKQLAAHPPKKSSHDEDKECVIM